MKISRKERRKVADQKRRAISHIMLASFEDASIALSEEEGYEILIAKKYCLLYFDELVNAMVEKHPHEAHLIRSAAILSKDIIRKDFKNRNIPILDPT